MIDVHEHFAVPADPRTVWSIVSNPREVVSCVPGATLGNQNEDGSYDGSLTVKFGPVTVTFNVKVLVETDDATMTGQVSAQGKDTQGGTRIRPSMTFKVAPEGAGASVAGDGKVEISGRLAGMIEGGAAIVVKKMSSEFAKNLEKRCAEVTA
jgi:carbon monoxide dehydrogenase subunit G